MGNDIATSVAKNTAVMMASQVVTWISSFILMMFLPRYLGSEDFGRLYLAISLTMMVQIFIEFGGHYLITKEVSRAPQNAPKLVGDWSCIRVLLWTVSMLSLGVFTYFAGYSSKVTALILILGVSKLWEGIGKVLNSFFQGIEKMQYPCVGAIAERVIVTVTGVAALMLGADATIIAICMAGSTLLNTAVVARFAKGLILHIPQVHWKTIRSHLRAAVPYFLWAIFSVIYFRIGAVMLSLMTSESVVGWYGAAFRLFDVLMFLPIILSAAVFPVLSRLWATEHSSLSCTTQKGLEFVMLAGIPVSITMFQFSEPIIQFFFGLEEYGHSVLLLQIFSVGLLLVYIDFVLGTTLFASDRQRLWTITAVLAVVLNPVLNLFLIPYTQTTFGNGGIGAAIATIVTEFFVMVMALSFIPQEIFNTSRIDVFLKGIGAGVIMFAVLSVIQLDPALWILRALIGSMAYIAVLAVLKTVDSSEVEFLRSFFSIRSLKSSFVPEKETST